MIARRTAAALLALGALAGCTTYPQGHGEHRRPDHLLSEPRASAIDIPRGEGTDGEHRLGGRSGP